MLEWEGGEGYVNHSPTKMKKAYFLVILNKTYFLAITSLKLGHGVLLEINVINSVGFVVIPANKLTIIEWVI
jgi:hypothetical protein